MDSESEGKPEVNTKEKWMENQMCIRDRCDSSHRKVIVLEYQTSDFLHNWDIHTYHSPLLI